MLSRSMSATDAAPDADRDRATPDDGGQPLALERGHRLGVPDALDPVAVRGHDHGRGDHRAGGGGDADLVHAHDAARAIPPQGAFPAERGDDHGHRATAYRARPQSGTPLARSVRRLRDSGPCSARSRQVDVFTTEPGLGNALAVVLDGDGLSTEAMQRFATLDEPVRDDVRRRRRPIRPRTTRCASSRPTAEIPFAGHPTLGHVPRVAGGGRHATRPGDDRPALRLGPRRGAAHGRWARLPRAADAALGPGRRG